MLLYTTTDERHGATNDPWFMRHLHEELEKNLPRGFRSGRKKYDSENSTNDLKRKKIYAKKTLYCLMKNLHV